MTKQQIIEILEEVIEHYANVDAGCGGCLYEDKEEWELPCKKCKRSKKDYWRRAEG